MLYRTRISNFQQISPAKLAPRNRQMRPGPRRRMDNPKHRTRSFYTVPGNFKYVRNKKKIAKIQPTIVSNTAQTPDSQEFFIHSIFLISLQRRYTMYYFLHHKLQHPVKFSFLHDSGTPKAHPAQRTRSYDANLVPYTHNDVSIQAYAYSMTSVFGPSDAHGLMTSVFGPSD